LLETGLRDQPARLVAVSAAIELPGRSIHPCKPDSYLMANPNPSPETRFGINGHAGRAKQKGARDRLSAALLTAFAKDFEEHGEGVIAKVRESEPATYLRIASTIIPKEVELATTPLDEWTDEELEKGLAVLKAQVINGVKDQ